MGDVVVPQEPFTRQPPAAARMSRHVLPPIPAHPDVPADAVLFAIIVYGPNRQPVEVLLPFPTVSAADHHARSRNIDSRIVPIAFPFHPRQGV